VATSGEFELTRYASAEYSALLEPLDIMWTCHVLVNFFVFLFSTLFYFEHFSISLLKLRIVRYAVCFRESNEMLTCFPVWVTARLKRLALLRTCFRKLLLILYVSLRNSFVVQVRFLAVSPAESKRGIQCMTTSGSYGVWLAGQGSSKVMLFHSTTYEQLLEVNVAPAVSQKLQSE